MRCPLPAAELSTLQAIADGGTYQMLAAAEGISEDTLQHRVTRASRRLGVRTRLEAIFICAREGWIVLDGLAPVAPTPRRQHGVLRDFDRHLQQTRGRLTSDRDWMDELVDDLRRFGI